MSLVLLVDMVSAFTHRSTTVEIGTKQSCGLYKMQRQLGNLYVFNTYLSIFALTPSPLNTIVPIVFEFMNVKDA